MPDVQTSLLGLPENTSIALEIADHFDPGARSVLYYGDCLDGLASVPDEAIKLIITSPPYNIGKAYEDAAHLDDYLAALAPVADELVRVLSPSGSLCWQLGNYVDKGEIFALDIFYYPLFKQRGLKLRNRVVWYYEHGLHASKRFSGRYETLLRALRDASVVHQVGRLHLPSRSGARALQVSRQASL